MLWIMLQLGLQKADWSLQMGENDFLAVLTWIDKHSLIVFFCQKRFHWLTLSTRINNPVFSESTESLDNVQLTICTPLLNISLFQCEVVVVNIHKPQVGCCKYSTCRSIPIHHMIPEPHSLPPGYLACLLASWVQMEPSWYMIQAPW